MVTDARLKEACAEVERFLLSTVPELDEPHVFSPRFERKMAKLLRRAKHPIRYQVMRAAAAVVLAVATLFGGVMAVSPEARAAVVGWVRSAFFEFFAYANENPQTNDVPYEPVKYEYHLSEVPEGYREWKVVEKVDGKMYLYLNDAGNMIQFTYACGAKNAQTESIFIETEKYMQYSAMVNGLSADIYIALEEKETSVIVWEDTQGNALIQIFAIADKETLVKIAETVVKTGQ